MKQISSFLRTALNKQARVFLYGSLVSAFAWVLFLLFQNTGLGAGDSGDLVTAIATYGVAHPPGYPLFTILGILVSKLPFFTIPWRIGMLSSLPHALVIGVVFSYVFIRTKQIFPALLTILFLTGNYVFFLYSVTQEVFALYHILLILFILILIRIRSKPEKIIFFLLGLVLGTSVAHHHLLFFLLPVLIGVFYSIRNNISFPKILFPLGVGLVIGLIPLLYLPIAGGGNSPVNWDRPTTVSQFTRLLLRQDYGTFLSNGTYGKQPIQRVLSVLAYVRFLVFDFRIFGIIFFIVGLLWMWKQYKKDTQILFSSIIVIGPIFFFYASFPFINRFTIGTYERFLIGSYILVCPFIGIGGWKVRNSAVRFLQNHTRIPAFVLSFLLTVAVVLPPATLLIATLYRIYPLRNDRTIENLGEDILRGVAPGSIVLLGGDTALFSTQFARYVSQVRKDTIVVHESRLGATDYPETLRLSAPALSIPASSTREFRTNFILANKDRPIYTIGRTPLPDGYGWLPQGLVYRLLPISTMPSEDEIIATNSALFAEYHDPFSGALATYNHLLLADAVNVYSTAYGDFGKLLLLNGRSDLAHMYLTQAVLLAKDTQTAEYPFYLGLIQSLSHDCTAALESINKGRTLSFGLGGEADYYASFVYRDCVGDATKAAQLMESYEHGQKEADLLKRAQ